MIDRIVWAVFTVVMMASLPILAVLLAFGYIFVWEFIGAML